MKIKDNTVWAIISARSGSVSIPHKNIYKINKRPIIAYSIAAANKSKLINRIIVSTDSREYMKIAKSFGAEVPFLRPKSIAKNNSLDIDFFKHLINWFRINEKFVPEYLLHLRPTTPIRNPKIIDKAIKEFIGSKFSALRSVQKMSSTAYKTFEVQNYMLKNILNQSYDIEKSNLPRQVFNDTYEANGYVDIVRTSMIDKGIFHGRKVKAFITNNTLDLDSLDDLKYLEFIINRKPELLNSLFK